jgi:hypothetical protein
MDGMEKKGRNLLIELGKFLHIVQTGSGVHPTSYKMGTGDKVAGV